MFFPGETITHVFYIPFSVNEIDYVILSYKQNGAVMFEKTITSGFEADSSNTTKISHTLSQDESLLFSDNADFSIQCNVYTVGGTRHTSHEMKSSSGIQYLRDILESQPLAIVIQPSDYQVDTVGDTAVFNIVAQGACKYQWQYQINNGEWKNSSNGTNPKYEIESTAERIATHKYRCIIFNHNMAQIISNAVKITYQDRSDE